jgi:uncharacterized Fe-S radical SAM superfamily protein PflX
MSTQDYLNPLAHCTLCEHRCGADRLAGQTGVCRMTLPVVASTTLHVSIPDRIKKISFFWILVPGATECDR